MQKGTGFTWSGVATFVGLGAQFGGVTDIYVAIGCYTVAASLAACSGLDWIKGKFPKRSASAECPAPQTGEIPYKSTFQDPRSTLGGEPSEGGMIKLPMSDTKPLTLRECFDQDFTNLLRIFNQLQVQSVDGKETVTVDCALFLDHAANSDSMSLYVPHCGRSYIVCGHLAGEVARIRGELKARVGADARRPGDITSDKSNELTFSGRVYVYHEDELSLQELAALDNVYKQKQLAPKFRGHGYAVTTWLQKQASGRN